MLLPSAGVGLEVDADVEGGAGAGWMDEARCKGGLRPAASSAASAGRPFASELMICGVTDPQQGDDCQYHQGGVPAGIAG